MKKQKGAVLYIQPNGSMCVKCDVNLQQWSSAEQQNTPEEGHLTLSPCKAVSDKAE